MQPTFDRELNRENGPLIALDRVRFNAGSSSCSCAGSSHQPALSICLDSEAESWRYWRRPSSAERTLKDQPIAITGLPDDFISPDDERLFAFVNTLRLAVKAKVAAEQRRGLTLAEIVVQVREMVLLAEAEAQHPAAIPPSAFRSISRQAVAWCVEAFHPPALFPNNDVVEQSPRGLE